MDQGNKLYIGNLPYTVDQTKLQQLFEGFGEVTEVVVISDRFSGKSKGFGFVTFKNAADAEKALKEMNEKEVDGRKLMVSVARPKKEFKERKSF